MQVRLATQRKSLRKFSLRPLATTCQSVWPGPKKGVDQEDKTKVTTPRTIVRNMTEADVVHLHVFADASNLACCAAAIAVVEHSSAMVKGLLTSKSRISKKDTPIARLRVLKSVVKWRQT